MTWVLFVATAAVVVLAGIWLARYGDVIAELSGLGRAWIGVVLLAATTSLPELFTGVTAAMEGLADIAVGDVVGSCMFNLVILSLMDSLNGEKPLLGRAQPGHGLSVGFGGILVGMAGLGMVLKDRLPSLYWWSVLSPAIMVVYLVAARLLFTYQRRRVAEQAAEIAQEAAAGMTLAGAAVRYGLAAIVLVAAATQLPGLASRIAAETGLGEAMVGNLFVAFTTSLPEVVVSIMAVRMGAIDLAMGNVLGSNLFNIFILAIDDAFYRPGPILAAAHVSHLVTVIAVLLMYGIVLVGLTYQALRKKAVVNWDTGFLAAVYGGTIWAMYVLRD